MTGEIPEPVATVAAPPPGAPPTAGAMLRAAREAAGLSLDAVAQQLKLAPRQVTALEEGDYSKLPGRTFVRGFLRNYSRLVRVDAEAVLAALHGSDTPSLDSPALHPTAPTMGELPVGDHVRPGWTRWAIPLTLVAVIATAAVYELYRPRGDAGPAPISPSGSAPPEPERTSAPKPPAIGSADTPLANPMAEEPAPADPAAKAATTSTAAPPVATVAAPPAAGEVTLLLKFRDESWTEVKDGRGQILLAQVVPSGQARALAGTPPFDVVIGNASEATVTFRGRPVDLAPYTRQNVARLVLE